MKNRIVSILLLLFVLFSLFCLTASAMGEETNPAEPDVETVETPAPGFTIGGEEFRLAMGQSLKLTPENQGLRTWRKNVFSWQSSDENIAAVTDKGSVEPVSPGTTIITCTATVPEGETYTATATVTVYEPVTSVMMAETESMILPGESFQAECTAYPEEATDRNLRWSSEDETVVAVNDTGLLTAIAPGTVKIFAASVDGTDIIAEMTVRVPFIWTENNSWIIDTPDELEIPIFCITENFDNEYSISADEASVRFSVLTNEDQLLLKVGPEKAGETRLVITKNDMPNEKVELLFEVTDDAICGPYRLVITDAEIQLSNSAPVGYQFSLHNNTTGNIGEIGYIADFRDQFGDSHYCYSKVDGSMANYQFTQLLTVPSGETVQAVGQNDVYGPLDAITEIRIAVNYFRYIGTGERIYIPDEQLCWYSTLTGPVEQPRITDMYREPEMEILDKAERIHPGMVTCDLYRYVSKTFARSYRSGEYVCQIQPGSFAEQWGLRPGDVIYGEDGVLWNADPFIMERAIAGIYDGNTVTLMVVRNGEEIEIPISRSVVPQDN